MLISEQHLTEFCWTSHQVCKHTTWLWKEAFVRILITKSVWDLYYNSVTISQMLITTDNNFNLPCLLYIKLFAKVKHLPFGESLGCCTTSAYGHVHTHTPHTPQTKPKISFFLIFGNVPLPTCEYWLDLFL